MSKQLQQHHSYRWTYSYRGVTFGIRTHGWGRPQLMFFTHGMWLYLGYVDSMHLWKEGFWARGNKFTYEAVLRLKLWAFAAAEYQQLLEQGRVDEAVALEQGEPLFKPRSIIRIEAHSRSDNGAN